MIGFGGARNEDSFDDEEEWEGETGGCMRGSGGETDRGGC